MLHEPRIHGLYDILDAELAVTCPHCGAPVLLQSGQRADHCPYCRRQLPPSPVEAAPPAHVQAPTYIIVSHGHHDDDDDDDDVRHGNREASTARAVASGMSWLTWVIVCVILTVVGGGGASWAWLSKRSALGSSLVWDGSAPFRCTGNDVVNLTGVKAEMSAGTAITVTGNCRFTCTDCSIKAPTIIEASGNGSATIVNGSVLATEVLADAAGNARVDISGNVTAAGEVKKSGNAKVSAPTTSAPAAPASATPTTPTTPASPAPPKPAPPKSAPPKNATPAPKASGKAPAVPAAPRGAR